MRVVLDTNVWVSGLLWTGPPAAVLRLAEDGRVELCATAVMLDELFGVQSRSLIQNTPLYRIRHVL